MNQTELAIKANMTQTRISEIENNFLDAKMSELISIAEAMDIHLVDLIDFKVLDKETIDKLKEKINEIEEGLD